MRDKQWLPGSKIFFLKNYSQCRATLSVCRGTIKSYNTVYQYYTITPGHDNADRIREMHGVDEEVIFAHEDTAIEALKVLHKRYIEVYKKKIAKMVENIKDIQKNTPGDTDE